MGPLSVLNTYYTVNDPEDPSYMRETFSPGDWNILGLKVSILRVLRGHSVTFTIIYLDDNEDKE